VPSDALKAFRRNAVHVRQALAFKRSEPGRLEMENGFLQDDVRLERYKRLSIPVRRALNPGDRASLAQTLSELKTIDAAAVASVAHSWTQLVQELDSTVQLGGSRVPRRQILTQWLDAAAFYDRLDRDRAYEKLIEAYGLAAEGMGAELTETAAEIIVQLDTVAAAALHEPEILPPPTKTPPPPPDPERKWWQRLLG
jgi:hypothetical protein